MGLVGLLGGNVVMVTIVVLWRCSETMGSAVGFSVIKGSFGYYIERQKHLLPRAHPRAQLIKKLMEKGVLF